jgi:mannitol-1-phosphate 5-dehydrogenase
VALTGTRTYVGFGFGAIQAGLFLYEAFHSEAFRRLVVAEVLLDVVSAVSRAEGYYTVNIAHSDQVEHASVGPIEIQNPALELDRGRLIHVIAEAEEIGTAIPSVAYYVSEGPGSLHRILAEGLREKAARGGPQAVVYTAENHNRAAEILEANVLEEIPEDEREAVRSRVRFLNTVNTITPGQGRAFLAEAFNRILISKIAFEEAEEETPFRRGIAVFEEKGELIPFEEAKLYGHNATHALAAYLGAIRGMERIANLRGIPGVLSFLRSAFVEESGEALIQKHAGVDPLFTREGYTHYADDLLERMTNPYLRDTVERVGRDPQRKLGWDDRLIGTMRVALSQGIEPWRYAVGAAAALETMDPAAGADTSAETLLGPIWREASPEKRERKSVLDLVEVGRRRLRRWQVSGFQDLEY